MQLEFKAFDGRSHGMRDVTDSLTGKTVGFIQSFAVGFGNSGGIEVSLFDGKYRTEVKTQGEVRGFIQGVQAVLNHMVHLKE